ncbi:hypothetical protein [Aestuariivirga sp.]|uniref:hypothetical protein n=1 Tax=Aestuariivirga sp. TaxID=2650926 RepID=UPI00359418CE
MTYTPEAAAEIEEALATLPPLKVEILEAYLLHPFANANAKEFAHHGLARRVGVLLQCVINVFHIIPPGQVEPISTESRNSAEINIHAFYIGVFGSLDNLARIWTLEKNVTRPNGKPLANRDIGLTPDYVHVRGSLTPAMQGYLDGMADWFAYLIGFRHSLAHRVPLYIPPHTVSNANVDRYNAIEQERWQAIRGHDYARADELDREQAGLTSFRAWITRSPNEEPRPVGFHPQMIADFRTVHEVAMRFIADLRAP